MIVDRLPVETGSFVYLLTVVDSGHWMVLEQLSLLFPRGVKVREKPPNKTKILRNVKSLLLRLGVTLSLQQIPL